MSQPGIPARAATARSLPRLAGVAADRARLSVVPRRRPHSTRVPFVVLVTVLLVGGTVGLLFFNTSMQQSSFTLSRLQNQAEVLQARQESLSMDLQRLNDPQVIARKAQRMHLAIPNAPLFLDLATGRVQGDRAAASVGSRVALEARPPSLPAELNPKAKIKIVTPPEGVLPEQSNQSAEQKKNDKKTEKKHKSRDTSSNNRSASARGGTQGAGR